MADSGPPIMSVEDHLSSFPSSIAGISLTEYSKYSQPADSLATLSDPIELTNTTGKTTDSQTNIRNLNPSIYITPDILGTMYHSKSQLPHVLNTMHTPCLRSQVLVPNPLLSNVTEFEGYVSIDQQFHETSNVLSPTSSHERTALDENPAQGLKSTLHPPSLLHTSLSNPYTPVNASPLGLNNIPLSTLTNDQLCPEACAPQVPVISTDVTRVARDIVPWGDSPLVDTARNGATQLHDSGTAPFGSESPVLVGANDGCCNVRYVQLHPEISHNETVCKDKSDIGFEEIQIAVPFEVPDAAEACETREKDDYFSLVSPSTSVRLRDGLEDDSINALRNTTVPKDQADESAMPIIFDLFTPLSAQNCIDGHTSTRKVEKGFKPRRQPQSKAFAVSRSLQSNMIDSKDKDSGVLQNDFLLGNSLLSHPQRNMLTDLKVVAEQPPGKRRRLHDSNEEPIKYQEYTPLSQHMEPVSLQISSCSDEPGCQENIPVWERTLSDVATREESSNTKLEKHGAYLGTKESNNLNRSPDEKQNEQGDGDRGKPEYESIHERNGTNRSQENFINSGNCVASSPSHVVRSVEHKDGCMFMVLEVHEPAVCQLCHKKFPTQDLLDLHVGKKHNGSTRRRYRKRKREPKEYRCTVCNLRLANDANLRRHYQIVHEGETAETCSLCKANFNSHHGFVLHLRDLHGITPDSVQEKEGRNGKKRNYRRKNATNVVPKPTWVVWKCGSCSFFSDNKGNMTRHINIVHLKIADHVCEECSEVFKTKHNLQVHLMNRHPKRLEGSAEK